MSEWVEAAIAVGIVFVLLYLAMRGEIEVAQSESGDSTNPGEPVTAGAAATMGAVAEMPVRDETEKPLTVNTRPSNKKVEDAAESAPVNAPATASAALPKMGYDEEDEDVDPTKVGPRGTAAVTQLPVFRIVYDSDAATDEPTQPGALILVTATAQTDKGVRRKRNEDSLLVMANESIYAVADGMGGYRGGEIASELAVKTIEKAFRAGPLDGELHDKIPRRASELVRAIQLANEAIMARAEQQKELAGMGTTVCAARFSPNKQRLYVAHVGDSRMYRARGGVLQQMTSDHTMEASFGVTGEGAAHLSRAVGVWPVVPVDVILGKPLPGDVYLICSDGLTKMLDDAEIQKIVVQKSPPTDLVEQLVAQANANGGKDNISVILITVHAPTAAAPAA